MSRCTTGLSISKPYLIIYSDDSKRHCNRRELDLLRPHVREVGERKYLCTIPCSTVRMTATENTLATLATLPCPLNLNRLPGYFIAGMPEGTYIENGMESADSMAIRLELV